MKECERCGHQDFSCLINEMQTIVENVNIFQIKQDRQSVSFLMQSFVYKLMDNIGGNYNIEKPKKLILSHRQLLIPKMFCNNRQAKKKMVIKTK